MLTAEDIASLLIQNQAVSSLTCHEANLRRAAVLVPFLWLHEQWHLLFTRRTDTVQSHKGQVSFPGGAADAEDSSPEHTAVRETHEEIGLQPQDITILGRLQDLPTVTNYLVTPVVAHIPWPVVFAYLRMKSAGCLLFH
jgi:8-oxo-dGTP pyrophosphatase MutT (NUDIX family)